MAEITSVSFSFTRKPAMICLTLAWLTDWLEESNFHQTEGLTRQEMKPTDRLCVWFHEKTNRNTLAVTPVKRAFRVEEIDPIYLNIPSFSFQYDNTTRAIKLEKWKSWKRSFTDLFRCWSPSHLALSKKTWHLGGSSLDHVNLSLLQNKDYRVCNSVGQLGE